MKNKNKIATLFELPLLKLLYKAQAVQRKNFKGDEMQLSTLLNIKTGACPEDCAYCPQSAHYNTGIGREKLMQLDAIVAQARRAKANGATRFCMGAAWRSPPRAEFAKIIKIIEAVKELGLETCVTLGMLNAEQAMQLKAAGLNFYNHNLDTSPDFYKTIITTRTYQERLDTINHVAAAGIHVCCGGILGLGESRQDRIDLLFQLTALPQAPRSVPFNRLIVIKGTPLENALELDNFEFVRTVAVARIILPQSILRLSAGRVNMSEEMQALCFLAGISSIHFGEKLLMTPNPDQNEDIQLLKKLGMQQQKIKSC